jgi:hypothetical protein
VPHAFGVVAAKNAVSCELTSAMMIEAGGTRDAGVVFRFNGGEYEAAATPTSHSAKTGLWCGGAVGAHKRAMRAGTSGLARRLRRGVEQGSAVRRAAGEHAAPLHSCCRQQAAPAARAHRRLMSMGPAGPGARLASAPQKWIDPIPNPIVAAVGVVAAGLGYAWYTDELHEVPFVGQFFPKEYDLVVTDRVFFDITVNNQAAGRITMGLYGEIQPRTVRNFLAMSTGSEGVSAETGKPMHYQGTHFHRIIPNFMIQGGDTTVGDGTGGESIYGAAFDDEDLKLCHAGVGTLSMANAGASAPCFCK